MSQVHSKTFSETIYNYKEEIACVTFILACLAACIFLSVQAAHERMLMGDSSWVAHHDYWTRGQNDFFPDIHVIKDENLQFTSYTTNGSLYIAGAVSCALGAATMGVTLFRLLQDREILSPQKRVYDLSNSEERNLLLLKTIGTLVLLALIFGCVYMGVQAAHNTYLEINKFTKETKEYDAVTYRPTKPFSGVSYTAAGEGLAAGSVICGIALIATFIGTAAAFAVSPLALEDKRTKILTQDEINFLRGDVVGGARVRTRECMEALAVMLFGPRKTSWGDLRIARLGTWMRSGALTPQEVKFLDSIFSEYCYLRDTLPRLRRELATIQGRERPTHDQRMRQGPLQQEIGALEARLAAVQARWEREEYQIFNVDPQGKSAPVMALLPPTPDPA